MEAISSEGLHPRLSGSQEYIGVDRRGLQEGGQLFPVPDNNGIFLPLCSVPPGHQLGL